MNYYEELGIRPDADEEEIRKAHRRLVKLMHPDQHRDAGLKQLAETQMRRLNSIVATLLDPEERAEYDDELRGVDLPGPAANQSAWRSVPWWIASTLGAIVLTVGAVWFWADRIGSSFTTHTPTVVENPDAPAVEKPRAMGASAPAQTATDGGRQTLPTEGKSSAATTVAPVLVPGKASETIAPLPSAPAGAGASKATTSPQMTARVPNAGLSVSTSPKEPASAKTPDLAARKLPPSAPAAISNEQTNAPRAENFPKVDGKKKLGDLPLVGKVEAPRQNWDNRLQAPAPSGLEAANHDNPELIAGNGSPSIPRPPDIARTPTVGPRDPLEGEWVYAPTEPEKRKAGFYPPEFINLKLIKQPDGMHGQYSARYNVADSRPISPDVSFALKSVDKTARKYVWTATDGSQGTFVIRSVETDTMRLEWRTTSLKGGPALTSGMATLVRRVN